MKIKTRVIVLSEIFRSLAREERSKNGEKRRGERRRRDKTSRSGRFVLIKRTQGPRTLNTFEPADVSQRRKIVKVEERKKEKKNVGSGVYKVVFCAWTRGSRMMDGSRRQKKEEEGVKEEKNETLRPSCLCRRSGPGKICVTIKRRTWRESRH